MTLSFEPINSPSPMDVSMQLINNLEIEANNTHSAFIPTIVTIGNQVSLLGTNTSDSLYLQVNLENVLEFSNDGVNFFRDFNPLTPEIDTISLFSSISLNVELKEGNDQLYLSKSLSDALTNLSGVMIFDGGSEVDTLIGSHQVNTWNIDGNNRGNLNENINFNNVENLTGAQDIQDSFVIVEGGGISGKIDGNERDNDLLTIDGGNYNSVIYTPLDSHSGIINLDEKNINFTGQESLNINVNTSNILIDLVYLDKIDIDPKVPQINSDDRTTLLQTASNDKITFHSDNSTFVSPTFIDPTSSLSIQLRGGNDTLSLQSLDANFAAHLSVIGGEGSLDTISIDQALTLLNKNLALNAETVTFKADVNTLGGNISVDAITATLAANINTLGGNISVDAATISLDTQNHDVTLSTRKIAANGHQNNDNSLGNSGSINFTGYDITLGSSQGQANLLTHVEANSSFSAGEINLNVSQVAGSDAIPLGFENLDKSKVGITLNNATVKGGLVAFHASADHSRTIYDDPNASQTQVNIETTISKYLESFSLIGGVAISKAEAKINLGANSNIIADNFEAIAEAISNASTAPIAFALGVAVGIADSKAEVIVAGNITTKGNTFIRSGADNTLDVKADAGDIGGASAATAVSVLDSISQAHITDQANINVGGNLIVQADTVDRNSTLARSTSGKDGFLGISAAISDEDGETSAVVDGSVNVMGNLTINALQRKEVIEASKIFVIPTTISGVAALAGVNTDSKGSLVDDTESAAINFFINHSIGPIITEIGDSIWQKIKELLSLNGDGVINFSVGSAVAIVDDSNKATATIANGADVESQGAITIEAKIENSPDVTAGSFLHKGEGTNNVPDSTKIYGVSTAVAIGNYTNDAQAYIDQNAQVDAVLDLSIKAEALNEYQFALGKNIWDATTQKADFTTDNGIQTIESGNIVEVKEGHSAGGKTGLWYKYIGNKPGSQINLSQENFEDKSNWKELNSSWVKTQDLAANLTTYLDNNLGLDNNAVNSWSQSTAEQGTDINVAGTVTVLNLNHTSQAYIANNAQVNQDSQFRSGQQNVAVESISINEAVHFGGNISLPGISGSTEKFTLNPSYGGFGTTGGDAAIGATVLVVTYKDQVFSTIQDQAKVYADSLKVDADNTAFSVALAASAGDAGTFGFNGTFSLVDINHTTHAQIDNGARVTVGTGLTTVAATDDTKIFTKSGVLALADAIGVGASIAINNVKRDTQALIGNFYDAVSADDKPTGGDKTLLSEGKVTINAENKGFITISSGAVAATSSSQSQGSTPSQEKDAPQGAGKYGIGVSGNVSLNSIEDRTLAYIHDAVVVAPDLEEKAKNESEIISLSGAVAIVTGSDSNTSVGLAGSYSQNTIEDTTKSFIDNSDLTLTGNLSSEAITGGDIVALAASGSVVTNSDSVGLAGQVSINQINNLTEAAIVNQSQILSANRVTVKAQDSSNIFSVAGALAYGTQAGIGSAVALNNITNQILAHSVNSEIHATGPVTITAKSDGTIESITTAIGASEEGMAAAVSVSINTIANTVTAGMANHSTVQTNNILELTSEDNTNIYSQAGGIAGAEEVSIGAAVATNDISANIIASVDTSNVSANSINLVATTNSSSKNLTVGGAGAESFALGGSVSLNKIKNTLDAHISQGSTVNTSGLLNLEANDHSIIEALAGGEAGAEKTAVGAAVATNDISNNLLAVINSSTATAKSINLDATANSNIKNLTLGGTGAEGFVLGGSVSLNKIKNTLDAHISQGSTVNISETIDIKADDHSTIKALAGGAAGAEGAAIGAAVATNEISNNLLAFINSSTVTANSFNLEATSNAKVSNLTAGIAGAVGFALGGSISLNKIHNTLDTHISQGSTINITGLLHLKADDNSTIEALAGGAAGAEGAAVGIAFAKNEIDNTLLAYIDHSTATSSTGNIKIDATSTSSIRTLSAGGAGAEGFAAGASNSSNQINNTLDTHIGNSSTVNAKEMLSVESLDSTKIEALAGGGAGAYGAAAAGSLADNTVTNTVKAFIEGSKTTSAQAHLSASSDSIIKTASGAGSGAAGLAGVVSKSNNQISNTLDAHISQGSTVTTTKALNLKADDLAKVEATAGGGSGAAIAAVGAALSTNNISNNLTTYIEASTVQAEGSVTLNANSSAQIKTLTGGGSGAAGLAVAGSDSNNQVRNTLDAHISNGSKVENPETLLLSATDNSKIEAVAGEGSGAFIGAVGAAKATNDIGNTLTAYLDNSTVKADSLDLFANSNASLRNFTGGGNGAAGFALGGSISNNQVHNTLDAHISNNTNVELLKTLSLLATDRSTIEAAAGVATGAAVAAFGSAKATNDISNTLNAYVDHSTVKAGNVNLFANSIAVLKTLTTGGAGAAGVALAGADSQNKVSNILNAHISNSSDVSAQKNVDLKASDDSSINTFAGGGAGSGLVTIGASVATNDIQNQIFCYIDKSLVTTINGSVGVNASITENPGTISVGGEQAVLYAQGGSIVNSNINNTINAYISNNAIINSGSDISVQSKFNLNLDMTVGVLSAATVGQGRGSASVTLNNVTNAYVNNGSVLQANGNVDILANSDVDADVKVYAGSGGVVALESVRVKVDSANNASAYIDANAKVTAANDVNINSTNSSNLDAEAFGVIAGIVASGAVVANAEEKGTTKAYLGDGVQIGSATNANQTVNNLTITATANSHVLTNTFAAAGGIGTGSVNKATATTNPTIQASIGDNANIDVTGDIQVNAQAEVKALSKSQGILGALAIAVGKSVAETQANPIITSGIGTNSSINAGHNLQIGAYFNIDSDGKGIADAIKAQSNASVIATGSDSDTESKITSSPTVTTTIGSSTSLNAANDLNITAQAYNAISIQVEGSANGLLTRGSTSASVDVNTRVQSQIQDNAKLFAHHNLDVTSGAMTKVTNDLQGGAGKSITDFLRSIFSGNINDAFNNLPSILAIGGSVADIVVSNMAITDIGLNVEIVADNQLTITAQGTVLIQANAAMSSGGAIAASGTTAMNVIINDADALVHLRDGAKIKGEQVRLDADNQIDVDAKAEATTRVDVAGAFATGLTRVNIGNSSNPSEAKVLLGINVTITANNNLLLEATNHQGGSNLRSYAKAYAKATLVKAVANTLAEGNMTVQSNIESGIGTKLITNNLTTHAESNYVLDRIPESTADTAVHRFVEVVERVLRSICRRLPFGRSLCNQIVDHVTRLIEQIDADANSIVGGSGVNAFDRIALNGEIITALSKNRLLVINADGTIDPSSNVAALIDDHDILVEDIVNDKKIKLEFLVPYGQITSNALIRLNKTLEKVRIVNYSNKNLVVGNIELFSNNFEQPDIVYQTKENDFRDYEVDPNRKSSQLDIENFGHSDIIFSKSIGSVNTLFNVFNQGGTIKSKNADVYLESGDVGHLSLVTKNGDIGYNSQPLKVKLIRNQLTTEETISNAPAELMASAKGNIFLDIVGVNATFAPFDASQKVDGILLNLNAIQDIDVIISQSQILDEQLNSHDSTGVYNLINATGGNVRVVNNAGAIKLGTENYYMDLHPDNTHVGNISSLHLVQLKASGSILDGDETRGADIIAPALILEANGAGLGNNALEITTNNIEAKIGTGGLWLANQGGLTVGGIGSLTGISSNSSIDLTITGGALTMQENMTASEDISLSIAESSALGEDLQMQVGTTIKTTGGLVKLLVGDNVDLIPETKIEAATKIIIYADYLNADPDVGSTINLQESVAPIIEITTDNEPDLVILTSANYNSSLVDLNGADDIFRGGKGNDTVFGKGGNNLLIGNDGNDYLDASDGEDTLEGSAGNDTLLGSNGRDLIFGDQGYWESNVIRSLSEPITDGDDRIFGGSDNDTILAGGGSDYLEGLAGEDILLGDHGKIELVNQIITLIESTNFENGGDDTIIAGIDRDIVIGGARNDLITNDGDTSPDVIYGDQGYWSSTLGGDSSDRVTNDNDTNGIDILFSDQGEILALENGQIETILSLSAISDGNDTLYGEDGNDKIFGGGKDDQISGVAGEDILFGDHGKIVLEGTAISLIESTAFNNGGNDAIDAGLNRDWVVGGGANDLVLNQGDDADIFFGDQGRISIGATTQIESLSAPNDGDDTLPGEAGNDTILGGGGQDSIGGVGGEDVLFGDHGKVVLTDDVISVIESTAFDNGGNDTILAGVDADTIMGGASNDLITNVGDTSSDVLYGDQGYWNPATISNVTDPHDGNDQMFSEGGNDIILGGGGKDSLESGIGSDIVLGDHGIVTSNANGITRIETTESDSGDNDTILAGNDDDTVFGGPKDDYITGDTSNNGDDLLIGDQGYWALEVIVAHSDSSSNPDGADTIFGNGGNDTVFGNNNRDYLRGNQGLDVIIGDYGLIKHSGKEAQLIDTQEVTLGNDDFINGDQDKDTLLGGTANDSVQGGADGEQNIILGDNGTVVNNDGTAQSNDIFSHSPFFGGIDRIVGGSGDDTIIGGSGGSDTIIGGNFNGQNGDGISGGAGNDIILGDNAYITRNNTEKVEKIEIATATYLGSKATATHLGGDDYLVGNSGRDSLVGGFGYDSMSGGDQEDILFGDNAIFDYSLDRNLNTLDIMETVAPRLGGRDTLEGSQGGDFIFGGTGGDSISGGFGDDLIFGDHAKVSGVITPNTSLLQQSNPPFTATAIFVRNEDLGGDDFIAGDTGERKYPLAGGGNDLIFGQQGNDFILGEGGQDSISGGHNINGGADANDKVDGGSGNDVIAGDNASLLAGNIQLFSDSTSTSFGSDFLLGGAGDDRLFGQLGNDNLRGDSTTTSDPLELIYHGNDYIEGGAGEDILYGDLGQDSLIGGSSDLVSDRPDGADTIYGGTGVSLSSKNIQEIGSRLHTFDADVILGDNGKISRGVQFLDYGLNSTGNIGGADILYGETGNDEIYGMTGDDTIWFTGGGTDNSLYGGVGRDIFAFSYAQNYISASELATAMDFVQGEDRVDVSNLNLNDWANLRLLIGNDGQNNTLLTVYSNGEISQAKLNGINPNLLRSSDFIFNGNSSSQIIEGTDERDQLFGGLGDDTIRGRAGSDTLFGEVGNDRLEGGLGNDDLYGGSGNDTFVCASIQDSFIDTDVVQDFVRGQDKVDVSNLNISDWDTLQSHLSNDAQNNALITIILENRKYEMKLNGIDVTLLEASDFIFSTNPVNRTVRR